MTRRAAEEWAGTPPTEYGPVAVYREVETPPEPPPQDDGAKGRALFAATREQFERDRIARENAARFAALKPWEKSTAEEQVAELKRLVSTVADLSERLTGQLAPAVLKANADVERLTKQHGQAQAHAEKCRDALAACQEAMSDSFANGEATAQDRAVNALDAAGMASRKAELSLTASTQALEARKVTATMNQQAVDLTQSEIEKLQALADELQAWADARSIAVKVAKLVEPLLVKHSEHGGAVKAILKEVLK